MIRHWLLYSDYTFLKFGEIAVSFAIIIWWGDFFLSTKHFLKSHSMIGCLIWRKNVSNEKTSTITDGIICLSITRAQNSRQRERMETSRSEPTVSKTLEKSGPLLRLLHHRHYSSKIYVSNIWQALFFNSKTSISVWRGDMLVRWHLAPLLEWPSS